MKPCRWIIETQDYAGQWIAFAKTDHEGNAALIANCLAQRIGTARYGITGKGSVQLYKHAAPEREQA